MSIIDKVTVGGTTYDVQDTPTHNFAEVDVELGPYTEGYYSFGQDATELPESITASTTYGYVLIDASEGDMFRYTGRAPGNSLRMAVFVGADNAIIQHWPGSSDGYSVITAPAGTQKVLFQKKLTSGQGYNNACYVLSLDTRVKAAQKNAAPKAMVAANEEDDLTRTAANAYAAGDYFLMGGLLYRVRSAIAVGDTIYPGTTSGKNCVQVTIGSELTALRAAIVALGGTV